MNTGNNFRPEDIALVKVQFTSNEKKSKNRPALILYKNKENYVVSGITSNLKRAKFRLEINDFPKSSVIRLDYVFTSDKSRIYRKLTSLKGSKKWIFLLIMLEKRFSFCK